MTDEGFDQFENFQLLSVGNQVDWIKQEKLV